MTPQLGPTGPSARLNESSTGPAGGTGTTIVHVQESVDTAPEASVARTVNVCEPRASDAYVCVVADVQEPKAAPSSRHSTEATALPVENVKLAEVCDVGFAGFDAAAMVTVAGTGSRVTTATLPVSVGPPGSNGYGG